MKDKSKWLYVFLPHSLIILTAILCYSNSFNVPFHYDDRKVILSDYKLRDLHNLYDIVFSNPTRGLSSLSFALNYYINRFNPFGYHLVNLFFHIINGILVYLISYNLIFKTHKVSFLASLFFVAHPINVESVTYISSRSGVMSTTFFLLSMIFFIKFLKYSRSVVPSRGKLFFSYLASIIFFLLSIGSKETGATLPFILILYESCFSTTRRNRPLGLLLTGSLPAGRQVKTRFYFPFFVIIGALMVLRRYFYGTLGNPTFNRNYYVNILTQINVSTEYIRLLFFPINLNIDHDFPLTTGINFKTLLSLVTILLIFYLAFKFFKTFKEISFSILWFFIALSPTSIIPLEDVLSERWLYLPSVGFSIFLSLFIYKILMGTSRLSKILIVITPALIVLCFSLATYYRNHVWQDGLTLWSDAVKKSPEKARPHNNLGAEYLDIDKTENGFVEFKKAVMLEPGYIDANLNLGAVYGKKWNFDKAFFYTKRALALDPKNHIAFNNLGNIYEATGKGNLAVEAYKKAIKIMPDYGSAHFNLGITFRDLKMPAEAEREFKKAIELDPEIAGNHIELGLLYIEAGRTQPAFNEFKKALELDSKNAGVLNNLGIIYGMNKNYEDAEQMFKKALKAVPSHINAGINLAQIYIQISEYDNAIVVLKNTLKFAPDFYEIYNMLGKAYQLKGAKDEAIKNFKTSLRLNPEDKKAELALKELE
ncbi:MAG: hypothetical protein A3C43_06715 [Candidatus Schekmanbacteria bacterium RIFCSPHIGHO2_02_FULL_38_11]|uniref:Uncharacterized protein n=1 Tax=Candidatus Schekmanbacteria bacterium RIFCSPLOWO2_12_FULL_38_15 TaxID=1817883 RepID=A0A1F7SP32_9BACT|nr:MAG: hypothetical protein A2043_01925 [Candidatus Schekmanbacteria bacterium GWA2_38_9]OGL48452.1 MAG: hypothetical protein A3H37_07460 [Candidatus Schekmanbacteria bacterium RIFCSPLOWO2_02_FULL_38_14]OGL50180.1 MAG: hypothetical protein A3C43_06715 [Candidatus Schekmanbacteria bacterium RIFCSPHIGHO2_02_FULL_38_11]OGL54947.1 MAG: hypothetical protein A3G31_02380 [Candidatus Schekmanbacteria bacterium RIFCSPLOWO2_12_FULL_38_15]